MTDPETTRCCLRAMADAVIPFNNLSNFLYDRPRRSAPRHVFHIYRSERGSPDAVYLVRAVEVSRIDNTEVTWSVRMNISTEHFDISAGVELNGDEGYRDVFAVSEQTTNAKHAAECITRFAAEVCAKVEYMEVLTK